MPILWLLFLIPDILSPEMSFLVDLNAITILLFNDFYHKRYKNLAKKSPFNQIKQLYTPLVTIRLYLTLLDIPQPHVVKLFCLLSGIFVLFFFI